VYRTRVGYAGGTTSDPTYRNIGDHTECIQVDFDPEQISYELLLDEFFGMHDATRAAYSTQYASLVLAETDAQRHAAFEASARYGSFLGRRVVTQIRPLERFHAAEDYHQKYGLRNDRVLLAELRGYYPGDVALRESTAAMRLNGFAYSGGRASLLAREIESYGLTETGQRHLQEIVGRR